MKRIINNLKYTYKKYNFLMKQLIVRDFKVKYKRSFLGVIWSLLYPLLTMAVMALVFTNVFKFSTPGVNYLVYLLSGLVLFNYFSEASNLAMSSVVANFSLINKVYMPKYIFPLSKCLFVNFNTFIYNNFFNRNRSKCLSYSIAIWFCLLSIFYYWDWIYISYNICFYKRHVLHIWSYNYIMDLFNTNNVRCFNYSWKISNIYEV